MRTNIVLIMVVAVLFVIAYSMYTRDPDITPVQDVVQDKEPDIPPKRGITPVESKEIITLTDHNTENGWKLVWNDEFGSSSLNDTHWNALEDGNGWGKREQFYVPDNVEIIDGVLNINILREQKGTQKYTSGAITTKDKVNFKYGKIEVRAKMPGGRGLIPAIWMLPTSGKEYPEIDFAELIGQEPEQLWNVVHDISDKGRKLREFEMTKVSNMTTDFHTYGIEWNEDSITYFFDGKETFTGTRLVPNEDMYLFINTGVGGTWVGSPDSTTVLPNKMLVDYVRYYK